MLEQLYTPKAIVALMALILVANRLLLYQFLGDDDSTTQTADAPWASESPRPPTPPPDDEEEATEEDAEQGVVQAPQTEEDTPQGAEASPPESQPSPAGATQGEASDTPFSSQYDPPPTGPGGGPSGGGEVTIQTVFLSTFFEIEGDDPEDPASEVSILPATSGVGFFPFFVVVAVIAGAAMIVLRRGR